MHKKIPDSYSKREGGNPGNSGLVSTIDGSTLPQVGVEELLCGTPSTLVKHTNKKIKKQNKNRIMSYFSFVLQGAWTVTVSWKRLTS